MSFLRQTISNNTHPGRSRSLSSRECRTWLGNHHKGRLGYQTGRGPRAVVVNYEVADDQIMFCLPDYSEIPQYALGEQITLEVAGDGPADGRSETVTVAGLAHSPDRPAVAAATHFDETWPSGVSTHLICLALTELQGTEIAD
jgi:hypothetical protein